MQPTPIVVQQSNLGLILTAATPIILVVSAVLQAWLTKVIASKQEEKTEQVAQKVEDVATVTAKTAAAAHVIAENTLVLADKTHILVNSQMGQQLMLHAITARTLAKLTNNFDHLTAADEAEKKLADHQAQQAIVDNKDAVRNQYGGIP